MTRAVIVGSGMAGLTAAAYLVRDGCDVDVFEQADHIGGVTATLRKEGFAWDLGPLLLEGFAPGEPAGNILAELGCADRVELVRGDRGIAFPDYRVFRPAEYLGPYWRRERLKEIFSHEAEGLDRYYRFYDTMLDLMTLARQAEETNVLRALPLKLRMALLFNRVKRYQNWNAQQVMDHFFSDPKLKALFLGILADMVVCPSEFVGLGIPAVNQEAAFDNRLPPTVSSVGPRVTFQYVVGGCGNLVEAVAGVIRENGGRLHTSRPVRRVLLEGERVRGVELGDGERREADLVLVSGGARECFFKLVGREALPADFAATVDDVPLMESVFMLHLGVDMDPSPYQDVPLNYYYGTYDVEGGVARTRHADYHEGKDGFLIYIPSFHSPTMAPPGQHAITIYTIAPNKLEGGWQARRQEMVDKLLHEAEKIIPGLREHARVVVSLTPVDFGQLTYMLDHHSFGGVCPVMGKGGASYRTPFEGLWFLGAQSESAGGVHNVTHGARNVFNTIRKTL
ncbi:MAG: NAD(P)/FAD-dependent oxidoreductase [Chloroflexota bacterium]|nr:NAD(P)/FAD-dependent oxidoreductase [Chloroflexota bacterium]